MKKRIGTKLYDTDKAELILPSAGLYKQSNKQTYFYYDGMTITPVKYDDALNLLQAAGIGDLAKHSADCNSRAKIGISPEAADHLSSYCRAHNVTQKKIIEDYIYTLEI